MLGYTGGKCRGRRGTVVARSDKFEILKHFLVRWSGGRQLTFTLVAMSRLQFLESGMSFCLPCSTAMS